MLKAGKSLEFNNITLQLLVFIGPSVDMRLSDLPVLSKPVVVYQNCPLDGVCHNLELLMICFILLVDLSNLGSVGSPLPLCIICL